MLFVYFYFDYVRNLGLLCLLAYAYAAMVVHLSGEREIYLRESDDKYKNCVGNVVDAS
ncbi:hypothetical protein Bca4012_080514 [Brassica carinata]|uniref:Uncharacterized protein n=1 Tax=Brassica oleracea TaxID=3712 RepID=A0A3P6ET32_BRAOL|nr:unnamed protein product [Brassica oleracea]